MKPEEKMTVPPEDLLLYASGELDPARRSAVAEALATDPAARAYLAELEELEALGSCLPGYETGALWSPADAPATKRPAFRLLFPLATLLGIGLLFSLLSVRTAPVLDVEPVGAFGLLDNPEPPGASDVMAQWTPVFSSAQDLRTRRRHFERPRSSRIDPAATP